MTRRVTEKLSLCLLCALYTSSIRLKLGLRFKTVTCFLVFSAHIGSKLPLCIAFFLCIVRAFCSQLLFKVPLLPFIISVRVTNSHLYFLIFVSHYIPFHSTMFYSTTGSNRLCNEKLLIGYNGDGGIQSHSMLSERWTNDAQAEHLDLTTYLDRKIFSYMDLLFLRITFDVTTHSKHVVGHISAVIRLTLSVVLDYTAAASWSTYGDIQLVTSLDAVFNHKF